MNKILKTLIPTAALCAGVLFNPAAQAHHRMHGDANWSAPNTRAEVKEELAEARADGTLATTNSDDTARFAPSEQYGRPLTRAEVKADLAMARVDGRMKAINSEDPAQRMKITELPVNPVMAETSAE